MFISCEKAALLCNKTQYREATPWERVKLKLHLLMCKTCSVFAQKNKRLTLLCQKARLESLSEQDKRQMKEALEGKFK